VYAHMVETQLALGRPLSALEWAERGRARAFLDMMGNRASASATRKADPGLVREHVAMRDEMDSLRAELTNSPEETQRRAAVARSERLAHLSARHAQLLERIGEASPELASTVSVAPRPISEVQATLAERQLIIAYFSGPRDADMPMAWAISPDGVRYERLAISRGELDDEVRLFHQLLTQPATPYPTALGRRLYDVLLAPFADLIESASLVCIVPHGSLHYLPFHALDDGEGYFVRGRPVSYAPSANALMMCRERNIERKSTAAIYANPKPEGQLPPLRFAEVEARTIAERFADALVLMGAEATEPKMSGAGSYDIIHFATHGEMNPWAPLLSCLHLTADGDEDGRLEVHEIFNLKLDAYLVTLSACETALGDITSGDDMIGLSRAFMYAGTPSVIASLWRVDDEATARVMGDFYDALSTQNKAESIRAAQMQAIDDGAHPYYWAAFNVIGDWR
jgi:CHAT domain-containing protein